MPLKNKFDSKIYEGVRYSLTNLFLLPFSSTNNNFGFSIIDVFSSYFSNY